ncbi:sce7726 family protein [Curvibacter sp. HBC28]|uniref:Sce7726 family protein n=1 Tax=Curvibacter microcysteis TaxID=3026419 RepID=A0ABT5MAU1_9BURK|nr:sce7726 family protein [Curvibacter sp. HBC28]MDD0813546.1 sce7726 family protein [Curvibacter sp. HBC28]
MNEAPIRVALIDHLRRQGAGCQARFISELFIDRFGRRADLVQVGTRLAAFEIKSEYDRLDRLPGQLLSYCRFFERVTVVCAPCHGLEVKALVPTGVGVWQVNTDGGFQVVQAASLQKGPVVDDWLSFLPVSELRGLLRAQGLSPTGSRESLLTRARVLSKAWVRQQVLSSLRRRADRPARRGAPLSAPMGPTAEERLQAFLAQVSVPAAALPRLGSPVDSSVSSSP